MKFGIQTYLFRLHMLTARGEYGVISRLAEMGYDGIELFHAKRFPPARLQAAAAGKTLLNPHVTLRDLTAELPETIAWAKALGVESICLGYVGPHVLHARRSWLLEVLTKASEACGQAGLMLCYHNHAAEFRVSDGIVPMWEILRVPGLKWELDAYWAERAQGSVERMLEEYGEQIRYLHLKDETALQKLCPLGSGVVDLSRYLAKARESGCPWCIVDLDRSTQNVYRTAEQSLDFLRGLSH